MPPKGECKKREKSNEYEDPRAITSSRDSTLRTYSYMGISLKLEIRTDRCLAYRNVVGRCENIRQSDLFGRFNLHVVDLAI